METPQTISQLHELASRPNRGVLECLQSVFGNVLVVGAGGKMGFHLSLMLKRGLKQIGSPAQVIAVSRFSNHDTAKLFEEAGIVTIAADLTDPQSIKNLPVAKFIFFLAGIKFGTADDQQLLQQINVELPTSIGRRFGDANIVALSTGCVYPFVDPTTGGSVETDLTDPPGEYALSCLGREQAFASSGAKVSLIRLNYSVDLRYGVLVDLALKVFREQPIDVSTGLVNVIWQGDANRFIIQSLKHANCPPFVLNVTGQQILKVREVAKRFGELFGKQVTFTGSESKTAWLNQAAKCHQRFGMPNVSENTLIEWVADWIRNGGELLNKPTHFENRDGNY